MPRLWWYHCSPREEDGQVGGRVVKESAVERVAAAWPWCTVAVTGAEAQWGVGHHWQQEFSYARERVEDGGGALC